MMTGRPLADLIRPTKISEFIGQEHLLGIGKVLRLAIAKKSLFSMVMWGPPGVGKTTLARILAKETDSQIVEFSATNTKIKDVKALLEGLDEKSDKKLVIFIDEIHRYNKAQQDALLPHVESGRAILIGATTENPSFELTKALLSRVKVLVLKQLGYEELKKILLNTLEHKDIAKGVSKMKMEEEAIETLIENSNGDARTLLNTLELIIENNKEGKKNKTTVTKEAVLNSSQARLLKYDKNGDEHYDTISAFIKSMRASDVDAALYYLARMVEAGEDPLFIARRMVIFASEDIGIAQPTAIVVANEIFKACEVIGYPECQINLAHGVVYLTSAKKDRSAYEAYFKVRDDVQTHGNLAIPMHLRNAPTKLMKDLGYGKKMDGISNLPEKIKNRKYWIR